MDATSEDRRSAKRRPRWQSLLNVVVALAGLVIVLLLFASPALAPPPSYPDVPASHPYYAAITDLAGRGIINGYTSGNFGPSDPVTRQQFAKMIVLSAAYPVSEADVCLFTDVEDSGAGSLYPDNYVAVAAAHGITVGTAPGVFSPGRQISRYQVITMVVRTADVLDPGLLTAPPASFSGAAGWSDSSTHSPNARRAEYNHLLDGLTLASLDPWGNMPRGEVAQVLHNLLGTLPSPTTTTTAPTTPRPLELLESGYTVTSGTPFVEYAVIIRNPNSGFGAIFPTVRITMRDAAGSVLGVTNQVLHHIMPGETLKWGDQANPNGTRPASVQFEVLPPGTNWKPADQMEPVDYKPFEIVGLRRNGTGYGITFTGELVNRNSSSFSLVAVSVLLRDQAGRLVAGYTGFISTVLAGGQVPFEVHSLGEVPGSASMEAYAQIWLD